MPSSFIGLHYRTTWRRLSSDPLLPLHSLWLAWKSFLTVCPQPSRYGLWTPLSCPYFVKGVPCVSPTSWLAIPASNAHRTQAKSCSPAPMHPETIGFWRRPPNRLDWPRWTRTCCWWGPSCSILSTSSDTYADPAEIGLVLVVREHEVVGEDNRQFVLGVVHRGDLEDELGVVI